jgi:hypothetical protein
MLDRINAALLALVLFFAPCIAEAQVSGGVTRNGEVNPGDIALFNNNAQIKSIGSALNGQCAVYVGTFPTGIWQAGDCAGGSAGPSSIQVLAGTGLGVTPALACASGTCAFTVSLAALITAAGPIGSSTSVPQISFNAEGQLTTVNSVAIALQSLGLLACNQLPPLSGDVTNTDCAVTIAAGAVTGSKIASATITGANIASATITASNLGSGAAQGNIASNTITDAQLTNFAAAGVKGALASGATVDLTAAQLTSLCQLATTSLSGCLPILQGSSSDYFGGDGNFHAFPASGNLSSSGSPSANQTGVFAGATSVQGVGPGTTGQTLVSNGPSSPPSYQSGGWSLINTLTANNTSTTLQDTTSFLLPFTEFKIVFNHLLSAASAASCDLNVQSGGSFQTASYIANDLVATTAATVQTTTTFIPCSQNVATSTTIPLDGYFYVLNPQQTTSPKIFRGFIVSQQTTTADVSSNTIGGWWNGGNGAITGFQIVNSAGDWASGSIEIYGRL